jgi:hypothetical protein
MRKEIKFSRLAGIAVSVVDESGEKLLDGKLRYLFSGESKRIGGNEGWHVGLHYIPMRYCKKVDNEKAEIYVDSDFAQSLRDGKKILHVDGAQR